MYNFSVYRSVPVGPEQVLLRGAHLRNTQWIFGELQGGIVNLRELLDLYPKSSLGE